MASECFLADVKGILEVVLILLESSVRVKMKYRGTVVVLNRYAAALCFLDVFEMVVR